jgi:hypothetical protein
MAIQGRSWQTMVTRYELKLSKPPSGGFLLTLNYDTPPQLHILDRQAEVEICFPAHNLRTLRQLNRILIAQECDATKADVYS